MEWVLCVIFWDFNFFFLEEWVILIFMDVEGSGSEEDC